MYILNMYSTVNIAIENNSKTLKEVTTSTGISDTVSIADAIVLSIIRIIIT